MLLIELQVPHLGFQVSVGDAEFIDLKFKLIDLSLKPLDGLVLADQFEAERIILLEQLPFSAGGFVPGPTSAPASQRGDRFPGLRAGS